MFVAVEMQLGVQVHPSKFNDSLDIAVRDSLNEMFANKVVAHVGLGITFGNIISLGNSFVPIGSGSSYTNAKFQYIFFRPFQNELIVGTIKSCDESRIRISLGFFDDIYIEPDAMQPNTTYNRTTELWVWNAEDDVELPLTIGDSIKFKVKNELFRDPNLKKATNDEFLDAPYIIYGYINEVGLGMSTWWSVVDEEDEGLEES